MCLALARQPFPDLPLAPEGTLRWRKFHNNYGEEAEDVGDEEHGGQHTGRGRHCNGEHARNSFINRTREGVREVLHICSSQREHKECSLAPLHQHVRFSHRT